MELGTSPTEPRHVSVYSDERKKIEGRWDYHCLLMVEQHRLEAFLNQLKADREEVGYSRALKFSDLKHSGKGEKVQLARKWMSHILEEADSPRWKLYFSVTGVDNSKIDFSFFGEDHSPSGKYATVYNRFFRASLQGMLRLFFRNSPVAVDGLYHDTEGNLQHHGFFDWHVITRTEKDERYASFGCTTVTFVNSDHQEEPSNPWASELIQFADILLGAVTYCIHITHEDNHGQRVVAEDLFRLVDEILKSPYQDVGQYRHFRRFAISHFPQHPIMKFDGEPAKGEYYRLRCDKFESMISGQQTLF